MPHKNVRIDFPYHRPDGLVDLAMAILAEHKRQGAASVISAPMADELERLTNQAVSIRETAKAQAAQATAGFEQSNLILGVASNQTASTPGTVTFVVAAIRDLLAAHFRGREQTLETYGFNVVVNAPSKPESETPPAGAK